MPKSLVNTAIVVLSIALVLTAACSRPKPVVAPEPPPPSAGSEAPTPADGGTTQVEPEPGIPVPSSEVGAGALPTDLEELNRAGYIKDVFFDTNQSDLRADGREILAANARWLQAHPSVRITVEGHADERNTAEFNLALGWRRANAVRDYLVSLGVAAGRITTISYGEERPFVTGHGEESWWQNRRAHLVITGR